MWINFKFIHVKSGLQSSDITGVNTFLRPFCPVERLLNYESLLTLADALFSAESIFNGDDKGMLRPTNNITHAETATVLQNYFQ